MSETAKIAAALSGFQSEMPTVPKGKTAKVPTKSGGSYSYTYADLADVTEAAMPILSKHGLAFSACPRRTEQGSYELVGTLLHSSGEVLTGALPISGSSEQQVGSSLTYQRRYLLGCMTGLVTDDDDDGQLAESAPKRKPAAKPKPAPKTDPGEEMQPKTRAAMFALFSERGIEDADAQRAGIAQVIGREVESRGDLTDAEAKAVIASLRGAPA